MLISIVIPTRNRVEYLEYCLNSCLFIDDNDVEIVVSDNNSIDGTGEYVKKINDKRIRYFNTGSDLSMRANFEYALDKASGDYIIFIGDDDAVNKKGIVLLREILSLYSPDVVNWRHITYGWPESEVGGESGILKFRLRDFTGVVVEKDPRSLLAQFFEGAVTNYREGANIYHGCVSRRLINKIKALTGEYFMAHSPDVYSSIANLVYAERFIWIRFPVTVGGESKKSNGAANLTKSILTPEQADIIKGFVGLAGKDSVEPEIDLGIRSLKAHTYASIVRVNGCLAHDRFYLNHHSWREIVDGDLLSVGSEVDKVETYRLIQDFYERCDRKYTAEPTVKTNESENEGVSHLKVNKKINIKKNKKTIDCRYTKNIMESVYFIDKITGNVNYYIACNNVKLITVVKQIIQMYLNFRKINSNH